MLWQPSWAIWEGSKQWPTRCHEGCHCPWGLVNEEQQNKLEPCLERYSSVEFHNAFKMQGTVISGATWSHQCGLSQVMMGSYNSISCPSPLQVRWGTHSFNLLSCFKILEDLGHCKVWCCGANGLAVSSTMCSKRQNFHPQFTQISHHGPKRLVLLGSYLDTSRLKGIRAVMWLLLRIHEQISTSLR